MLLGDNDRTPILPGVIPDENRVDEYYLKPGWEGNPPWTALRSVEHHAVHDVVVTAEERGLRCRERRRR